MSKEAVVIGYSGHAFVVMDILLANKLTPAYYCEKSEKIYNPFNLQYAGDERSETVANLLSKYPVFIGVGDNKLRESVFLYLNEKGISFPVLKHPSANIAGSVTIGKASVIMPGATINALSKIGNGVICNSSSVIEHECIIENFAHIGPGAVLAGNISIGNNSFIGANSVVRQGITIGNNVLVGAGSVVVKDIPDNCIVYGNPATIKV